GDLAALASPSAVAEKPAAPEANGAIVIIGGRSDDIAGLIDGPGAGEMLTVGFAGIDHAFELGVGQNTIRNEVWRQMRTIARSGRGYRAHGRRLHGLRRMRMRPGNTDRLKRVRLIRRIGEPRAFRPCPVDGLVVERHALRRG